VWRDTSALASPRCFAACCLQRGWMVWIPASWIRCASSTRLVTQVRRRSCGLASPQCSRNPLPPPPPLRIPSSTPRRRGGVHGAVRDVLHGGRRLQRVYGARPVQLSVRCGGVGEGGRHHCDPRRGVVLRRPMHQAYMLSPDTYNTRTWGRAIAMAAMDAMSVPPHEVVHLLQHAAGQRDTGKSSWSAEHDASRCAHPIFFAALAQLTGAHPPPGVPPPPAWVAPLALMQYLVAMTRIRRCKPAFARREGDATWGLRAASGADEGSPAPSVLAVYVRWMREWGMWNPAAELTRAGGTPYEDDAFKLLCSMDTSAVVVAQARKRGEGGVIAPQADDSATVRLLHACFGASRTGDLTAPAAMAALRSSLARVALDDVTPDSWQALLLPGL